MGSLAPVVSKTANQARASDSPPAWLRMASGNVINVRCVVVAILVVPQRKTGRITSG
jgi:hypothetical protein